MVHGLGWRREKGTEMDRLTKTGSTCPLSPVPHQPCSTATATERTLVMYLQLGYDAEVRASGRSKTHSKWKPPFSHVSVSVSLTSQLLNTLLLQTISWSASHFCFLAVVRAELQSEAPSDTAVYLKPRTQLTHFGNLNKQGLNISILT